ncbi:MAG: type II secretion system F family protein [Alphaproteobacteria bacterium]|nr:type II secretion system F family protein [Alphaproteobacteria bacterium]
MGSAALIVLTALLFFVAVGGAMFALSDGQGVRAQKRVATMARSSGPLAGSGAPDANQRRKSVTDTLKDIENQQAAKKVRPTLRRRLDQAGLSITPRDFYLISATAGLVVLGLCMLFKQPLLLSLAAGAFSGYTLPRWVLSFLKSRREKAFTNNFANAIDIIVRSVKSGLPTNEALKIVAREIPQPVAGEFDRLVESLKVGVTLEQGLKRMYESMPTAEVSFFGIVMTIQAKSGGNLSEALSNLANVLRDRKRLLGKIKAMSSEAKASAAIIGSLPPAVGTLVYLTSRNYMELLFTERLGYLMLAGCAIWMSLGIFVMAKMISFKH